MTLNTREYASIEQFEALKRLKRERKRGQLSRNIWLQPWQAKELGYNQGESDFELTPAEVEAGNVYGKIAQTPIEQPPVARVGGEPPELKPIAPEAGGNLRNLLLRLYPEKISGALAGGTKVDQLEDFLSKDVQNQIQTNPEQFLQDLAGKRLPTETRALLDYLNVPADLTDQIVGVQDTEIQVFQALNRIPEFAGIDVEELANLIETKPDEFFELIRTGGITPDKKNLLKTVGYTEADINQLEVAYPMTAEVREVPSKWKAVWNKLWVGSVEFGHQTLQGILKVLPQSIFPDVKVGQSKVTGMSDALAQKRGLAYTPEEVAITNTQTRQRRDRFRAIADRETENYEDWVAKHPELKPLPEWEGEILTVLKNNPKLILDPAFIAYVAADSAAFMASFWGATAVVGGITRNPIAGMAAGVIVTTPAQIEDLSQDLLQAGATEQQAANLAVPLGTLISSVEIMGGLAVLRAVGALPGMRPFYQLLRRNLQREIGKSILRTMAKRGVLTFAEIELAEMFEEVLQGAIQNAIVKTFDESRQVLGGIGETLLRTFITVFPLGLIGGGANVRVTYNQMTAAQRAQVNADQKALQDAGMPSEQAEMVATTKFAETPEGQAVVKKALDQAPKVTPTKPVEVAPTPVTEAVVTPEEVTRGEPVEPTPAPEVTKEEQAVIEQVRLALVETDRLDEVIAILPDGTALTGREFKGIGAFQHLAEDLPPVAHWLDAGVVRTGLEADGAFFIEIRGGLSQKQFLQLNKLMSGAKNVRVDFGYFQNEVVKTIEGTPNIIRSQLRELIGTPGVSMKAIPEVTPVTPEVTIPKGVRPDLYVADIEGMLPKTAKRVKSVKLSDGGELIIMSDEGDIYGLIGGEEVGFATKLSDTETDLSVAMEYRNKGIGTELMRQFRIENPGHPTGGLTEGGKRVIEKLTPTAPAVAIPKAEAVSEAKPRIGIIPESVEEAARLGREAEVKQEKFVNEYVESKGQKPPPPTEPPVASTQFPSDMPASQRVASRISFDPDKVGLQAKFLMGKNKAMSQWIDKLYPIDTFVSEAKKLGLDLSIEENPYIQARMLEGVTSKATTFLEDGTFSRKFWKIQKGKAVPNFKGESLSKILEEVKEPEVWRDFSTYLTAHRARELGDLGIKTGIDTETANDAIIELDAKYPDFSKLSDKIQKYQSDLMDYVQESGLISNDLRAKLDSKYISYVPFYRVLEELQGKGYMGKKMVGIASPVKRIKGSEREIVNPLESIVKNTYAFINAADRNEVGVSMARIVHDVPEIQGLFEPVKTPIAKVATVTAKDLGIDVEGLSDETMEGIFNVFRPSMFTPDNVVTVMIEGKKNFFKVDPDLGKALTAMDTANMGILWKILSSPAKWLRAGATLSPDFMIRNPVRDAMSAMVYSNYGFIPGIDTLRGVAHILKKDNVYKLYKLSGAEHSMLVSLDRDYLQSSFKEIVEGKKFTDYVKHPLGLLQIASELGEKATRLGEFARGIKSGAIPIEAGFSSREVTLDFAKAGTQAKAVNQIIAFFNANIRGWDRMITAAKDHPVRTTAKVLLGITLPSIILWAVNHDDERWKEIPQWQKDLFWIVFIGDNIYRIPKPFELGIIFGSGPERLLDYLYSKDSQIAKKFMENMLQAGLPGWLPTGIEPIIENITNHSFFRGTPIVSEGKQDLPPELQYTEYTSEVAKGLGKLLNQSPVKIDNLINGWTGGLGRYATEAIDKILEKTGIVAPKIEPSPTLADIPVVRAFVVRNPIGGSSESVNTFYDELDRYTALEKLLKGLIDDKKQADFEKEKAKHPELLFAYDDKTDTYYSASARYLRKVSGELSDIRKLQNKIYKATNMTSDQKRELITALDTVKTTLANRALELLKNPSSDVGILETPIEEVESKLGTIIGSPVSGEVMGMKDIAPELAQASGESPLKKLVEQNNKILADIANLPNEPLYKIDRATTKAGLTRRQNELLDQYEASTDKKQFLIDNPELKENPKVKWLTEHPEENAILALWGNSKLLTQKAYDIAVKMMDNNDIPNNALEDKVLPPKELAKPYFEFQDILKDRDEASWEAKLHLAKNEKLREYLGYKADDTPIASLELKVKNRANFDKLSDFSNEDSPDYIADEKKKAEAVKKFKADNPAFVDDTRRIDAIEKGTTDNPTPDTLVKSHVDYGKLNDKEGVGSSSAESMLFRVDNPEYDKWRTDAAVWGDSALKPVDQTKIDGWRIDVKYVKEDDTYNAVSDKTRPEFYIADEKQREKVRADYLKDNPDYATARRQREAYQKGLTGSMVKSYTDYYSLAEKGYRRERFLMDNSDFAQAVGLTVPLRVPSEQYDVINGKYEKEDEEYDAILKQYDRTQMAEQKQAIEDYLNDNPGYANDRLRRDAYKLYVPDNLVEHYVLYKELPAGQYQKDWFMIDNQDFYHEVYLGILENERLDFRKTPTREVYAKYLQYQDMPSRMKENYRFDNPDLEDWLILTGKVSVRVSEARRKAALTPAERLAEEVAERQRRIRELAKR